MSEVTENSFLSDVENHEMKILHDDGIYRHVRFKQPNTINMFFDLVTWPNHLAYSGDMGCYVFSRLEDMFEFFRTDRNYRKDGRLAINPSYWSEKLQAVDGNRMQAGATEFNEEKFDNEVYQHLVEWIKEQRHETTKEERRELWLEVIDNVINADSDSIGARKTIKAYEFQHQVNEHLIFEFTDFWERNFTSYTYRMVWCFYALAWGIKKYDEHKGITND